MAWICVGLDDVLIEKDPMSGEEDLPVDGALEAVRTLVQEGHKVTVFTSRFGAMPDSEKQRIREGIEMELQSMGFPPEVEVWTGTYKPAADIFIDSNAIPFDQDWGLALAHAQVALEDRGLVPGPQPGAAEQAALEDDLVAQNPQDTEEQP